MRAFGKPWQRYITAPLRVEPGIVSKYKNRETETEWLVGQHQELEMSAAEVIADDVETKGMLAVVVVH